jgi:hypothetical protein
LPQVSAHAIDKFGHASRRERRNTGVVNDAKMQGWQADPAGVHDERYFSAGEPTKLVRDSGVESYEKSAGEESGLTAEVVEEQAAASGAAEVPGDASGDANDDAAATDDAADGASEQDPDPAPDPGPGDLKAFGPSRPRGRVYAAVGLAAVVAVLAGVAIAGGFSSRPAPGTFGAISGSGSGSTNALSGGGSASLDPAAVSLVTTAAQRTLARKTADVSLSGVLGGADRVLQLRGSGQVDFAGDTMTANVGASYPGATVAEDELVTSQYVYLQFAVNGKNPLSATSGRHWMEIPIVESGADQTHNVTADSLAWSLNVLEQQPASVTALGSKTINGLNCTGYAVTPTRQALLATVEREWAQLGLSHADTTSALQLLQKASPPPITTWIDPKHQLLCELSIDMQFSDGAASGPPRASLVQMIVDFTHYGVPVSISQPAKSDVILF